MSRASDRAYHAIRDRIVSGALPPGMQLKEEELAAACGVSRTPVREALQRLEGDMLVEKNDVQRSFVAQWSVEDMDEMFTLRAMLEGHAAARAADRMSAGDLDELRRHNDAVEAAVRARRPDVDAFLEHNRAFHALVLETAGSARLTGLLARLIEAPVVARTAHRYDRVQLGRSHAEHAELIAAFERRDPEWAQAVMVGHIRRAFHVFRDAYPADGVTLDR